MCDLSATLFTRVPADIQRIISEKLRPPEFIISSRVDGEKILLDITIRSNYTSKINLIIRRRDEILMRYKEIRDSPSDDLEIMRVGDGGDRVQISLNSKEDVKLLAGKLVEHLESLK